MRRWPADLRLVTDAAERHPHELAAERLCDRLADRRLARAWRPDQGEDRAGLAVGLDPALLAELRDRDVLDDPVLDVLEPVVVRVEHLTRKHGVETLVGAVAPRHGEQPIEVAANRLRLGGALAHPLEPPELTLGLLAHGLGHLGLGDLRPELVGHRAFVVAELLADRLDLAAQEELALLLLETRVDVLADLPAQLHEREALLLQGQRVLQALAHRDRLQEAHLLLEGEVGGVPRRVGKSTRLGDRADEGLDAPVVAAQLEDLLDDGAVALDELAGVLIGRDVVGSLVDLDEQSTGGIRLGRSGDATMEPLERNRDHSAREPVTIGDLRDRADVRILALALRHEEHRLLVPDVDGQGHVHVGEDDDVLERDEQKLAHAIQPPQAT